ncbi:hypothetical protein SISNIDRAFT_258541 [Sistotremastrum niveocremeum HHB9708]|uniref:Zn(2)-C6 fungal-type domain-containing protein n=1 Tax=Sistotremastrum niveocremeum HHB9708 TaxID=1314777 RepID=A0A164PDH7_9AGAM|nr:hypothetical protein SISNIDRAFT_258541 [Sistotremastrum niveocremeum HHB9708]
MSTKHSSSSVDGDRGRRGDSPSSSNQSQKSRIPKSCDSCRKSHVRCVMIAKMTPPNCRRCNGMGTTCVFSVITPARGATRREIESMETRLQEAEAVLGMIQAFPDHRVQSLLGDMAQDPRTRKVFDHVHQSQFGPGVKFKPLDSAPGPSRLSEPLPVSSTTRPVDKAGKPKNDMSPR